MITLGRGATYCLDPDIVIVKFNRRRVAKNRQSRSRYSSRVCYHRVHIACWIKRRLV